MACSSHTREIKKHAYYWKYCIDSNQILHNDKDHQIFSVCDPKRAQPIQDGGRPPSWENKKSPYLRNRLTDFDEIWQVGHTFWSVTHMTHQWTDPYDHVTVRRARLVLGWVTVFGGETTLVFHQATQTNSASYPQRDGKWVPAKMRWCSAAGESRQVWFMVHSIAPAITS